jgi:catechol 2,3-dioxygenase-like lactoylglutathione lyase family enzyme
MIFQFWDDSNPTSIQSNHHLHSSFGVPQLQETLDTYGSLMGLKGGQQTPQFLFD